MVRVSSEAPQRLFVLWLAIGVGLCALFVYGCLMPSPPSEPGIPFFDKFEHAGAFVVMSAWFGAIFPRRIGRVVCFLALFAALTEIAQWLSGYRDGDPLDWCADMVGVLVGLLLVRWGAMAWLSRLDRRVATD